MTEDSAGEKRSNKARGAKQPTDRGKGSSAPKKRQPANLGKGSPAPKKRRLARGADAVRSRRRRAEERGIADQLRFERGEKLARARRARRIAEAIDAGVLPRRIDQTSEAMDWLEAIRSRIATVFLCSLQMADPVTGDAPTPLDELDDEASAGAELQRQNIRTPWLIVGRFDALVPIGYEDLGDGFLAVEQDLSIEANVDPRRLSQIRVIFEDPHSRRGEGDSFLSESGGWEYVISKIRQKLVVFDDDRPALAIRYEETKVPTFYVYFSDEIRGMSSVWSQFGL